MISKMGKMRDSWFTKIILIVTALSFMSLFGVSSYINTANNNKTVIKVDSFEVSQSEFNYLFQREMSKVKALTDDDLTADDELRTQVANGVLQKKLDDAILDNTMKKHHIDFSPAFIGEVILHMPQFTTNGKFDSQQYSWYLRQMGMTEMELAANIKRDLARKILLDSQVAFAKVPEILRKQMQKVMGERRTFKYIKMALSSAKVTRTPSEDELKQYYTDLKEEFTEPEKRDIELFYLSQDDISKNIEISDEEIDAYYKEHIDEYEQPEKRFVYQLVLDTKEAADNAYKRLSAGADFLKLAADLGQKKSDVELGYVSKSDVVASLGDAIFALSNGQISQPMQLNDSWQILKVDGIKAAQKTDHQKARLAIIDELKQEKIYDEIYDLTAAIEDKIAAEKELADIAKEYGVTLHKVAGIDDENHGIKSDNELAAVLNDRDLLEEIFSYNEGEITKVLEINDGIVAAYISAVHSPYVLPYDKIKDKLQAIWLENEKASIVQEMADNIEHDFEAGDDITTVAKRYALPVKNTMPVTRAENFDDLSYDSMRELFSFPKNYPTVIKDADGYIAAETTNIYDDTSSLSENDKRFLDEALVEELAAEMSDALLNDFAAKYKIEVNYNRAGLVD